MRLHLFYIFGNSIITKASHEVYDDNFGDYLPYNDGCPGKFKNNFEFYNFITHIDILIIKQQ